MIESFTQFYTDPFSQYEFQNIKKSKKAGAIAGFPENSSYDWISGVKQTSD